MSGSNDRKGDTRLEGSHADHRPGRGKGGLTRLGPWALLAYLVSLGLFLVFGDRAHMTSVELWIVYPAIGAFCGFALVGFLYEVFAIVLPFVLDTLRLALRRLLPKRIGQPMGAAMTRWWGRAPAWMRGGPWLRDDEGKHDGC